MNTVTIRNGMIPIHSFVDNEACERVSSFARQPANMVDDWNGQVIYLLDWRIADDRKSVKIEYQTRNDACAPILDCVLALETERVKLTPPNRSKAWEWRPMFGYWANRKTGERVSVY